MRLVAASSLSFAILTACQDRFPAGAMYSPASDSAVHVVRDANGKDLRIRPIGALGDAVTSIRISSVSDSTILLVVNGARASLGKISAPRLQGWLAKAKPWVNSAVRPDSGDLGNEIALEPVTSSESDEYAVRVELSRSAASQDEGNYSVYITVRGVSAWVRKVRPSEMGRFIAALGEASDNSLAMSGKQ